MNTASKPGLPPGPRLPASIQTLLNWTARPFVQARYRRKYGAIYRMNDLIAPAGMVVLSDPADVKTVFTGSPDVFHAGEANAILGPLVGAHSLLLLDRDQHLKERKLQLPAFHGQRIAQFVDLMRECTEREVATWPVGVPFKLHERTQRLTLDIIVRAVLGIEDPARAEPLHKALRTILEIKPLNLLMWVLPQLSRVGPWKRYVHDLKEGDRLVREEIARRRQEDYTQRDDILSMLLMAHDEAGNPVDDSWVRDEIMTMLTAGHETTATGLAWAFERLVRNPAALQRLTAGLDDPKDPYVDAVVKETLRVRPVIYNVARVLKAPVELGGYLLPKDTVVLPSIGLLHRDDDNFDDSAAFRPERWLDGQPAPYTWIPFGGGVRRCIGATFAQTEMAVVLRTVLQHVELKAADPAPEGTRVHHVTLVPAKGARVVVTRRRTPAPAPAETPQRTLVPA